MARLNFVNDANKTRPQTNLLPYFFLSLHHKKAENTGYGPYLLLEMKVKEGLVPVITFSKLTYHVYHAPHLQWTCTTVGDFVWFVSLPELFILVVYNH